MTGLTPGGPEASFGRLLEVIAELRTYCPWMGALTHESLIEYLIEETYELVDAIEGGHPDTELTGELGDVLLQVVLHARLAEESDRFGMQEVVEALTAKMVRRNPHVFKPDGSLQEHFPASVDEIIDGWHAAKRQEKPERTSPFDGIPPGLPALASAAKTLKRAEQAGLAPREAGGPHTTEDELGGFLLDVVGRANANGLDAERALRTAVVRLQEGLVPKNQV